MQIIKNRQLGQSHWQYPNFKAVGDEDQQAVSQLAEDTLLDYSAWLALNEDVKANVKGLVLQPGDEIGSSSEDLQHVDIIGIYFPSFTEGRGYTQAAILRSQLHFQGELRAINVYRDNLVLLEEVGFDAFDLNQSEDAKEALAAFEELELALA